MFQRRDEGGALHFDEDYSLPILSSRPDRVTVRFEAGYDDPWVSGAGDEPETRPQPIMGQLIALLAAHWFMSREPIVVGDIIRRLPYGFEDLLADQRIYR